VSAKSDSITSDWQVNRTIHVGHTEVPNRASIVHNLEPAIQVKERVMEPQPNSTQADKKVSSLVPEDAHFRERLQCLKFQKFGEEKPLFPNTPRAPSDEDRTKSSAAAHCKARLHTQNRHLGDQPREMMR